MSLDFRGVGNGPYCEHESLTLSLSEIFFLFLILKQSKYGLKGEKYCSSLSISERIDTFFPICTPGEL